MNGLLFAIVLTFPIPLLFVPRLKTATRMLSSFGVILVCLGYELTLYLTIFYSFISLYLQRPTENAITQESTAWAFLTHHFITASCNIILLLQSWMAMECAWQAEWSGCLYPPPSSVSWPVVTEKTARILSFLEEG